MSRQLAGADQLGGHGLAEGAEGHRQLRRHEAEFGDGPDVRVVGRSAGVEDQARRPAVQQGADHGAQAPGSKQPHR